MGLRFVRSPYCRHQATSEGPTPSGWGPINQVKRDYNGFGQLANEWQSHSGAVASNSPPTMTYGYTISGNASLMTKLTYPNSRVISYGYDPATPWGRIGLVSSVSDGAAMLETYTYLGMGVIGLARPLSGGSSITLTPTLDSLGRVRTQFWAQGTSVPLAVDQYGYDADGNLIYDNNVTVPTLSTLYSGSGGAVGNGAYTPLGGAQTFRRGQLNAAFNAIPSPYSNSTTVMQQDTQGNDTSIVEGGTDNVTVSYDAANAVASGNGNGSSGGNTTSLGTNTFGNNISATYDAWGRLVKDQESYYIGWADGTVIKGTSTFSFDALGRQIAMDVSVNNALLGSVSDHRELYYDAGGKVVEERTSAGTAPATQQVWSPVTGQMIERDRATSTGGSLSERLYPLYDPRGNVIAVADASGTVLERYIYDATGQMQALDALGTPLLRYNLSNPLGNTIEEKLSRYYDRPLALEGFLAPLATGAGLEGSEVAWNYYWQGMRFLETSGMYLGNGGQAYNPRLGRWMQPEVQSTGYRYSDEQLTGSWLGNAWNALVRPSDYGVAGHVRSDGWYWGAGQAISMAVIGGALMFTPLAPLVIVGGIGFLAHQGYEGYEKYGGFSGAAANMTGVAQIHEGWFNTNWRTGADLDMTDSQRGALFSGGVLQLVSTAWMGANLVGAAPRLVGYQWAVGAAEEGGTMSFGMSRFFRRLPREEGTPGVWSGERGNSNWFLNDPQVARITGGKGVPFREGVVDFSEWAERTISVDGLDGTLDDFGRIHQALAEELGLPSASAARNWLRSQLLSPHHVGGSEVQLVPDILNSTIRHTGGAYELRQ